MDGYRDERGAALERLAHLEEAHLLRFAASVPEQKKLLEAERFALLHPTRTNRDAASSLVRYVAIAVLFFSVTSERALVFPSWLILASTSLVALVAWYALDALEASRRRRRLAEVDARLQALAAGPLRVAPAGIAEIHVRISELEADEGALDVPVSPASRTSP